MYQTTENEQGFQAALTLPVLEENFREAMELSKTKKDPATVSDDPAKDFIPTRKYELGPFTSNRCANLKQAEHACARLALFANWPEHVEGVTFRYRNEP